MPEEEKLTEWQLYSSKYHLTNQIADDLKKFIKLALQLIIEFYSQIIDENNLVIMKEDLIELTTTIVTSDDVYKVVITFYKIETRDLNSKLIKKYK